MEVRQYLAKDNSFDVFAIAETRLGPEVHDNIIEIQGYSVLRQDRNIRGGDVLLYIKENLKAKLLLTSDTERTGKPLKPVYFLLSMGRQFYSHFNSISIPPP